MSSPKDALKTAACELLYAHGDERAVFVRSRNAAGQLLAFRLAGVWYARDPIATEAGAPVATRPGPMGRGTRSSYGPAWQRFRRCTDAFASHYEAASVAPLTVTRAQLDELARLASPAAPAAPPPGAAPASPSTSPPR